MTTHCAPTRHGPNPNPSLDSNLNLKSSPDQIPYPNTNPNSEHVALTLTLGLVDGDPLGENYPWDGTVYPKAPFTVPSGGGAAEGTEGEDEGCDETGSGTCDAGNGCVGEAQHRAVPHDPNLIRIACKQLAHATAKESKACRLSVAGVAAVWDQISGIEKQLEELQQRKGTTMGEGERMKYMREDTAVEPFMVGGTHLLTTTGEDEYRGVKVRS